MDSTESIRVYPPPQLRLFAPVSLCAIESLVHRPLEGQEDRAQQTLWLCGCGEKWGCSWSAGADFIFCNKIKSSLYADGNDLVDRLN